jgi:hypothetical protein
VDLLGPSNGNEYSGTADCSGAFCNTELAGGLRGAQHTLMSEMKKKRYLLKMG